MRSVSIGVLQRWDRPSSWRGAGIPQNGCSPAPVALIRFRLELCGVLTRRRSTSGEARSGSEYVVFAATTNYNPERNSFGTSAMDAVRKVNSGV